MPRPRWRALAVDDSGASAVEFGLIAPVLFLLLFGIMQFGLIFMQSLQVEAAAREGARYASLRYPASAVIGRVRTTASGVDLTGAGAITLAPAEPSSPLLTQNSDVVVTVRAQVPVIVPLLGDAMDPDGDGFYVVSSSARQRLE